MKLVVVTQQVDPADSVLGATVAKLRALAERVDELVVLTDSASEGALPDNVRVRTFRANRRAGRGMRFESALAKELVGRPRPSAVLATEPVLLASGAGQSSGRACASVPPSQKITEPQKKRASGPSRKAISAAISSGWPERPAGTGKRSMCGPITGSARPSAIIAVSVLPGATAFSVMPAPIHSGVGARRRTQWATASLVGA